MIRAATAYVEVRADVSQARTDVDRGARSLGDSFAQVFGAIAFGAGLKKAIDAGSRLEQSVGATEAVFGKSQKTIERWAESAAKSMGLSEAAAREALNLIGSQLKNFGFDVDEARGKGQELVGLGADLAATFGGTTVDAVTALSAVLRGEFDSIERYGVSINEAKLKAQALTMGLYDGKGAVDGYARAQAALALITEQTAAAQGQFARELDTTAGKEAVARAETENHAASVGQRLAPVYERVIQLLSWVVDGFAALPAPAQFALLGLLGIAAVAGPLSSLVGVARNIAGAIADLGTTTKVSLGVFGLLVAAGVTLWSLFSDGEDSTETVTAATEDLAVSLRASTAELLTQVEAIRQLRGELPGTTVGMNTLSDAVLGAFDGKRAGSAAELTRLLGEMGLTAQDAAVVLGTLSKQMRAGSINVQQLAEQITGAKEGTLSYSDAVAILGGDLRDSDAPINRMLDLLRSIGDESEGGIPDVEAMARAFVDQARGASDLTTQLVAQAEAQAKAKGQTGDAVAIYLEYLSAAAALGDEQLGLALDLDRAAAANAQAGDTAAEATTTLAEQEAATKALKETVADTRTQFDETADAADRLKSALDRVMGGAIGMEEAQRNWEAAADDLTAAIKQNGVTLDSSTEAGRANRTQIQRNVESILEYGEAMVRSGASNEEAAGTVAMLTEGLKGQLEQAGLTRDQIDAYLQTLGMTPENVDTAIRLAGDESAKERIGTWLDQLDDIPADVLTEIQADVEAGRLAEAERKIQALARARNIELNLVPGAGGLKVGISAGSGGSQLVHWMARGGLVDRPTIRGMGEAGPEAVLPLSAGSRPRLVELLGDPRIGGPVSDALAAGGNATADAAGITSSGGFGAGPITLIIEGHPFTAILAEHDQALVHGLTAAGVN